MKRLFLSWGLGLAWSLLGLGIPMVQAQVSADYLPRYLQMLGYSQSQIEALLAGRAGLKALDERHRLQAMGYTPAEIDQIVSGTHSRRDVDGEFGRAAIAAAGAVLARPADGDPDRPATAAGEEPEGAHTPDLDGEAWGGRSLNLARARPYWQIVGTTAQRFAVDPALILAVIAAESDFQPRAVSPKGAVGLMQLMPHTAEIFGATLGDLFNPGVNIRAGTQFLAECLETFGSERLALAAYNAGPSRVTLHQGVPPIAETRRYVAKVLRLRQGYQTLLGQYPIHGL